jgi:hypothetical protein
MDDKVSKLLEVYTLGEVLEIMDLTEEDVLEHLIDTGVIDWARLEDVTLLPVS